MEFWARSRTEKVWNLKNKNKNFGILETQDCLLSLKTLWSSLKPAKFLSDVENRSILFYFFIILAKFKILR